MRLWLAWAGGSGALGVAMAAMAAHSAEGISPEALGWIDTGARYGLLHAPALVGLALLPAAGGTAARLRRLSGWAFVAGTLLFSGMLYLMGFTGWRFLGMIVPLGGLVLIAGWLALLGYALLWRSEVDGAERGS